MEVIQEEVDAVEEEVFEEDITTKSFFSLYVTWNLI